MATAKALPGSETPEIRLWRERVDHSVRSSSRAPHRTVRDILGGNRRTFRQAQLERCERCQCKDRAREILKITLSWYLKFRSR